MFPKIFKCSDPTFIATQQKMCLAVLLKCMLLSWCFIGAIALSLSSVLATNDTSCPTWFYYDNTTQQCSCGVMLVCLSNKDVEISDGVCATSAGQGDQYYIGHCSLRHTVNNTNRVYSKMPSDPGLLDDVMCGPYNRKDLLCGECIDGFGPTADMLDMKCANCSNLSEYYAIPLYLVLQLLPVTLLFFCIVLFKLNITSGPLLGYIIFCQVYLMWMKQKLYMYAYITSHAPVALQAMFQFSLTLSQFWSLQYVVPAAQPFCISDKLSDINIQLLSLLPAIYVMVLVIVTFILMELHARNCRITKILWMPFSVILKKTNIKPVTGDAVIHAFASFIFLSSISVYATMGCVASDMEVYTTDSPYKHTVFLYPSLEFLGHKHIKYLSIGIVPFVFLAVIPPLFHILYPTRIYRYLSRCISARKRLAITAFAEALQVCFKDGLNGTRDYRAMAGLISLVPLIHIAFLWFTHYLTHFSRSILIDINFIITCCIITYIQPCKSAMQVSHCQYLAESQPVSAQWSLCHGTLLVEQLVSIN